MSLIEAGNEQTCDDLRGRLPYKLTELMDIACLFTEDWGRVLDALVNDLSHLKAAA